MEKPPYYAPLLPLAAHLQAHGPLAAQLAALSQQPFFKQYTPEPAYAAHTAAKLRQAQQSAYLLAQATGTESAGLLVMQLAGSVLAGAEALLASLGVEQLALTRSVVLREMGRLVVKHAFPSALGCYVAGAVGEFSVYRLPLAEYPQFLHIENAHIEAQAALSKALRQARYRQAHYVRDYVQANPNTALRQEGTGEVLTHFGPQHWQQLTWRLCYTTVFDLVSQAWVGVAADESGEPAPAELLAAVQVIARHCLAFFEAYLAGPVAVAQPTETVLA